MALLHPPPRAPRLAPVRLPLTILAALVVIVVILAGRRWPEAPAAPPPAPPVCTVRVTDAAGQPVTRAQVLLTRAGLMVIAGGLTDGQGELRLEDPELRRGEEIWVAAPGFDAVRQALGGELAVTVQLHRAAGCLEVQVVDDDGLPVDGARVEGSWRAPRAPQALRQPLSGAVGADGRAMLQPVGHGWVQLEAACAGWLSPGPVSLPPGQECVTLHLSRGRPLGVHLRDGDGTPLSGVLGLRLPPDLPGEAGDRVRHEAARRFCEAQGEPALTHGVLELPVAPATPLLLEAHAPGHAPVRLLVEATGSLVRMELHPGVSQWVQVVDRDGAPVSDAALVAGSCEPRELENRVLTIHGDQGRTPPPLRPYVGAVTAASGRALLVDLPRTGGSVAIHHRRLGVTICTLAPTDEEVQLVANGSGTGDIHGGLPPRLGEGLEVCAVGRFPVVGGVELSSHALWQAQVAPDGTFRLRGLPPGAYDVYARVAELLLVGQVTVVTGASRPVQLERF